MICRNDALPGMTSSAIGFDMQYGVPPNIPPHLRMRFRGVRHSLEAPSTSSNTARRILLVAFFDQVHIDEP